MARIKILFILTSLQLGCGSMGESKNFRTLQTPNSDLHFAESGDSQNPMVLFVHGTPGSWEAWSDFINNANLNKDFHLLAVDRPGFGKSSAGKSWPELAKQSEILSSALKLKTNSHKAILVGHSFGGPVVLQMALDYPELVGGIVLVASPADPELEKILWYQKLANLTVARWILPESINVCIDEIYPLKSELLKMEPKLKDLKTFVSIIQGGKDSLVPLENVDYLKAHINPELIVDVQTNSKWNHFIPWNQPQLILQEIQKIHQKLHVTK